MDFTLEKTYKEEKNQWIASISGEVDIFNSADFKAQLLDIIKDSSADLCLDCRELAYIDSTALGVLVAVLKNVKSKNCELYLRNLRPSLVKLFKITNLDKVFIIEGEPNE